MFRRFGTLEYIAYTFRWTGKFLKHLNSICKVEVAGMRATSCSGPKPLGTLENNIIMHNLIQCTEQNLS